MFLSEQECIPAGCVLPAEVSAIKCMGVSPRDTPGQRYPQDRDTAWTDIPWVETPPEIDSSCEQVSMSKDCTCLQLRLRAAKICTQNLRADN